MNIHTHTILKYIVCLVFLTNSILILLGQDQTQSSQMEGISNSIVLNPTAVPLLSEEEAENANKEAINAERNRKKGILNKETNKLLKELDYSQELLIILLLLIPVSILIEIFQSKKKHFTNTTTKSHLSFFYSPLLLFILILISQWIIGYYKKDYNSILYDHTTIPRNETWNKLNNTISRIKFKKGNAYKPVVFVNSDLFVEVPPNELALRMKENDKTFAQNNGYLMLPSSYTNNEIHIFSERRFFRICCSKSAVCTVFLLWLSMLILANRGVYILREKRFRQKCLCVGLLLCSFWTAGCFWISDIPMQFSYDGGVYMQYACQSNPIKACLYSFRTPGYPLFLSFVNLFSPLSTHSLIYFQSLIYLLSLSWLLYELYRKGVPMIIALIGYALFYNFMAEYFFIAMCETLELSCIATIIAISLNISRSIINKRNTAVRCLILLTIFLVFISLMIKPFPGIVLLPSGVLFFSLLSKYKFKNIFLMSLLLFIACTLFPFAYCSIRWCLCGDWNFASLVHKFNGAKELTIATPQSINADHITSKQKELIYDLMQYYNEGHDKNLWPLCNKDMRYSDFFAARTFIIYGERRMDSFFISRYKQLNKDEQDKYKSATVYENEQCRLLSNIGDPGLRKLWQNLYFEMLFKLYKNPKMVSAGLQYLHPYKSLTFFLLFSFFPFVLFLSISFVPPFQKIRYGSRDTIVCLIPLFIPLIVFLLQTIYLGGFIFETRTEMVMFFSTMLGTILLSMYCIYSLIISFILTLKLLYLKYAPERLKNFVNRLFYLFLLPVNEQ